jgi:membrane peptidoglycan carboxypeptidase
MSDPRYDPPPLREETPQARRYGDLQSSTAMWGWIAGAVVLALVLVFIFGRWDSTDTTATDTTTPPATTGMAPRNQPPATTPPARTQSTDPARPAPQTSPPATDQNTAR